MKLTLDYIKQRNSNNPVNTLITLDYSSYEVDSIEDGIFENLKNLQELYLCNNQLTSLPDSLGDLKNLQELHLWGNRIASLPEGIGNLKNLQGLYLWDNRIASLPKGIGNLKNLQELYLYNNQLTSLPDSLGDLKNLQKLDLTYNKLTSLPESLGNLKNLQYLNLGNNPKISITANNILDLEGKTYLQSYLIGFVKDKDELSILRLLIDNPKLKQQIKERSKEIQQSKLRIIKLGQSLINRLFS